MRAWHEDEFISDMKREHYLEQMADAAVELSKDDFWSMDLRKYFDGIANHAISLNELWHELGEVE